MMLHTLLYSKETEARDVLYDYFLCHTGIDVCLGAAQHFIP